jgi:hypothetical protein
MTIDPDDIDRAAETLRLGIDDQEALGWLPFAAQIEQIDVSIQTEANRLRPRFPTPDSLDAAADLVIFAAERLREVYIGMAGGMAAVAACALREIAKDRGITAQEALTAVVRA